MIHNDLSTGVCGPVHITIEFGFSRSSGHDQYVIRETINVPAENVKSLRVRRSLLDWVTMQLGQQSHLVESVKDALGLRSRERIRADVRELEALMRGAASTRRAIEEAARRHAHQTRG